MVSSRLGKWDLRWAAWFGRERVHGYALIIIVALLPTLPWAFAEAMGPLGSDFLSFWTAAKLTLAGTPADAYQLGAVEQIQAQLGRDHYFPYITTPHFLLVVAPFGLLPYWQGWIAWVAVTWLCWILMARRLMPGITWQVLAFPTAWLAAWHGQSGLLTSAIFIAAILAFRRNSFVAGLLFGLLIIKPHQALFVPLALVAARDWRAFAGASVSVVITTAVTWLVLGTETFRAFIAIGNYTSTLLYTMDPEFLLRMSTVYAHVRLPTNQEIGFLAQATSAAAGAVAVWYTWRKVTDPLARGSVLALSTCLATPYLFHYDLPLLILPICWTIREGMRTGFYPWERAATAAFFWSSFVTRALALPIGVNFMPWCLVAYLAFVLRRVARAEQSSSTRATCPTVGTHPLKPG